MIVYEKDAAKHISKMDKPTKQRIKKAIEKLPSGDVKKLQGYAEDYRLRVGDLRVIFFSKQWYNYYKRRFTKRTSI